MEDAKVKNSHVGVAGACINSQEIKCAVFVTFSDTQHQGFLTILFSNLIVQKTMSLILTILLNKIKHTSELDERIIQVENLY